MKTQSKSSPFFNRKARFTLVSLVLIGLSLACSPTGQTPPKEENTEDLVATSVAGTMAAQTPEAPPPASDTPPTPPTDTPTPTSTEAPDILYQGVTFSYDDSLATSINAETVPAETSEMGDFANLPEHAKFSFLGYPLPGTFHDPRILVYPVNAYQATNPYVSDTIASLQTMLANQPANPDSVPFLPGWNAAQFMQAQVSYFDFQNGSGVRFLTVYGQAAMVVNNNDLFYSYQGLTNDGQYYISAILPISHPSLPDQMPDTLDPSFYEEFQDHIQDTETQLNGHTDDSFFPTLTMLDAMMQSFRVQAP